MKKIICLVIAVLAFTACEEKTKIRLSQSDGVRGEMIIASNQSTINKRLNMLLNDTIAIETPGLIFSEPLTTFKNMSVDKYKSKFIKHHSVMKISIGDKGIKIKKNVQSKPQLIIEASGRNQVELFSAIIENRTKILAEIERNEKAFSKSFLAKYDKHKSFDFLEKNNIELKIPNVYKKVIDNDSVLWLRRYEDKDLINIMLTARKADSISDQEIIAHRNRIGKQYIHSSDSTYAVTEELVKPLFQKTNKYTFTTGMWQMEGDIFGGPFNSKSYYHNGFVYTFEGFLFAPRENTGSRGMKIFKDNKYKKRDFFREVYSILDEFKFINK